MFQSTYLYKVRLNIMTTLDVLKGFNPRTYIRYDWILLAPITRKSMFQSTYLYKVRLYMDLVIVL